MLNKSQYRRSGERKNGFSSAHHAKKNTSTAENLKKIGKYKKTGIIRMKYEENYVMRWIHHHTRYMVWRGELRYIHMGSNEKSGHS